MDHEVEGEVRSSVEDARNCFLDTVREYAPRVLDALAREPYRYFLKTGLCFKSDEKRWKAVDLYVWNQYQRLTWKEIESSVEGESPGADKRITAFYKRLLAWSRDCNLDETWCRERAYETLCIWCSSSTLRDDEREWWYESISKTIIVSSGDRPAFVFRYENLYPAAGYRSEVKQRILDACERELDAFLDKRERQATRGGMVKTPEKRNMEHFVWLVEHQVNKLSYPQIASKYQDENGIDIRRISEGITSIKDLIGLELRPTRGRAKRLPPSST